ncbi:MAG TPA: GH1 family beta-glucosidase [Fimbriimonadaceae bacterium]|nr:GH1 family beta-glucosidase [Fimbriimonadaceae bacterium]
MQKVEFKNGFVWGVATASYQIEGAADTDGRGESVWDAFCRRPGAVKNGDHGNVACDHYHRFREDIAIMRDMGVGAYRFSLSWSRILPRGTGRVNAKGLDFYDRLVDSLLEFGITPYATLFHWDYPQQLYLQGGWLNRDSVDWFGEYTAVVAERLSDRVQDWWTLDEPPCFLGLGHVDGVHAPGLKLAMSQFLLATKHALMAHGQAVKVLRSDAHKPPKIGYVPISHIGIPEDDSDEAVEAAREFTFGVPDASRSYWFSRLYLDPIVLGQWPEECIRVLTNDGPSVSQEDLALMCQPIDRLGLNFYSAPLIRMGANGRPEVVPGPAGAPRTGFDWSITPEGMYWSVRFHYERYGLPIMIAENGMSSLDWISEDGEVPDPQRIDFLKRYLRSLNQAQLEGYPVEGYFHWSLMDNFEWAEGYKHRFGLVHVDFQTLKRTVKESGKWYRDTIRGNGFRSQSIAPLTSVAGAISP